MNEKILINTNQRETRVALVVDGILQEVHIERALKRGIVGNIYMGKVTRVLPSMQAVFVDIGLPRAAFLHASDFIRKVGDSDSNNAPAITEGISALAVEGQLIVVQVIKDPLGTKGARLTTMLSLPSRYLVFMPSFNKIVVSQRIESKEERQRLIDILREDGENFEGAYIIRTAAEDIEATTLKENRLYLKKLWNEVKKKIVKASRGQLIYEDLPLILRVLRDYVTTKVEHILIDNELAVHQSKVFAEQFVPHSVEYIEYYSNPRPIFDLYNIEDEIQKALLRKVALKSGGYLAFDQTESMTTIDVNTGSYVSGQNVEETLFKTNLEAVDAIARQLRLRNLGGIIIIDLIDMPCSPSVPEP